MPFAKAVCSMPSVTGLDQDRIMNTFHFATDDLDEAALDALTGRLYSFYNEVSASSGNSIADFISNYVTRAEDVRVRWYDAAGIPPNDPIVESSFALASPDWTTCLPTEVACCLSLINDDVTAYPVRNRRGRLYLGPFVTETATAGGTGSRPTVALRNTLVDAAEVLHDLDDAYAVWVIWSRALGVSFPVTRVWVDDAWDTQRRRGERIITRTTKVL